MNFWCVELVDGDWFNSLRVKQPVRHILRSEDRVVRAIWLVAHTWFDARNVARRIVGCEIETDIWIVPVEKPSIPEDCIVAWLEGQNLCASVATACPELTGQFAVQAALAAEKQEKLPFKLPKGYPNVAKPGKGKAKSGTKTSRK